MSSGAVEGVHASMVIPAPPFCRSEAALTEHFGVEKRPWKVTAGTGHCQLVQIYRCPAARVRPAVNYGPQDLPCQCGPPAVTKCTACLLIMEEDAHVLVSVPASFVPA